MVGIFYLLLRYAFGSSHLFLQLRNFTIDLSNLIWFCTKCKPSILGAWKLHVWLCEHSNMEKFSRFRSSARCLKHNPEGCRSMLVYRFPLYFFDFYSLSKFNLMCSIDVFTCWTTVYGIHSIFNFNQHLFIDDSLKMNSVFNIIS